VVVDDTAYSARMELLHNTLHMQHHMVGPRRSPENSSMLDIVRNRQHWAKNLEMENGEKNHEKEKDREKGREKGNGKYFEAQKRCHYW